MPVLIEITFSNIYTEFINTEEARGT